MLPKRDVKLCARLAEATPVQAWECANVVETKPTRQQASGSCFRCGGNHLAHQCRHVGSISFNCEQRGHLAQLCRSNTSQTEKQDRGVDRDLSTMWMTSWQRTTFGCFKRPDQSQCVSKLPSTE
ncbi:uncharacterized protein ISCGN_008582 [Ixodes scapularis]